MALGATVSIIFVFVNRFFQAWAVAVRWPGPPGHNARVEAVLRAALSDERISPRAFCARAV
ncbi:MAG TPA: hypothetical protein DDX54_04905 [Rhodospirillaceae bacterium]|nr:hypothetical protein [Rhodospirillaceae bacterium]